MLELPAVKIARAVLRGLSGNAPELPDHHDVEVMNETGKVLAKRRLPEGVAGMTQLHELTGRHLPEDGTDAEVVTGRVDRCWDVGPARSRA